jgi:hypothetical protein
VARKASRLYILSRLWKCFVLVRINEVGVAYLSRATCDLIIKYYDKYRAQEHDRNMRQLIFILNGYHVSREGIDKQLAKGDHI